MNITFYNLLSRTSIELSTKGITFNAPKFNHFFFQLLDKCWFSLCNGLDFYIFGQTLNFIWLIGKRRNRFLITKLFKINYFTFLLKFARLFNAEF